MRQIFRQSALNTLTNPETSHKTLSIPQSRPSFLIFALIASFCALLIWAFTGTIPDTVQANGILVQNPDTGRTVILAPFTGEVVELLVSADESVQAGQVVARLQLSDDNGIVDIESHYTGVVTRVNAQLGETVQANTTLFALRGELENPEQVADLEALLYLPYEDVQRINTGMSVYIAVEGVSVINNGYLAGTVVNIAQFPASDLFAQALSPNSPVVAVRIELITPSDGGYTWTLDSEDIELRSGMQIIGKIHVREEHPIDRILYLVNNAR